MSRQLTYEPLDEIPLALVNPKLHNDDAIDRSLGRFGFVEPIVIDERTGRLVAGHGRVDALRRAYEAGEHPPEGVEAVNGTWRIPVVRGWASRSDAEAHALGVALNQTTIAGGFDPHELARLLQELVGIDADLVNQLGFPDADLAVLLAAQLDDWKPPAPEGDLEDYSRDDIHVVRFAPHEWEVIGEAIDAHREQAGDYDLTDAEALVAIARAAA